MGKKVKYDMLSHLEQILLRPETYIGDPNKQVLKSYILNSENMMEYKDIEVILGLLQLFEEILQNGADFFQNCKESDEVCSYLYVEVRPYEIVIINEGGIPIEQHDKHKDDKGNLLWIPHMIFGILLTSSNYEDKERVVGGKNGYGSKLANMFSKYFKVKIARDGKQFEQVYENNMTITHKPSIRKVKSKENYTEITFRPDFERFGIECFNEDMISLMKRRVYDMKTCLGPIKMTFNKEVVNIKNIVDYVKKFSSESDIFHLEINEYWKIGVTASRDNKMEQMSFVNGICTENGGKHVDYIANQIAKKLLPILKKKAPELNQANIKDNLFLVVISLIHNPSFDSQTKNTLTTPMSKFKVKGEIPPAFIKKLSTSNIAKKIIELGNFKVSTNLKKTDGKLKTRISVPKLEDAKFAGSKNSHKCTLILTEGDSAKSFAMSGLCEVGGEYYGVFPLKGKLMNVSQVSVSKVSHNEEISNLKKILGLKHGEVYDSTLFGTSKCPLRYGHVMIMTDQDHDGSHIKGLLINFFYTFWPELIKIKDFLQAFETPIVKITKKQGKVIKSFYTLAEYEKWKKTNNQSLWYVKYYKGLGTSTAKEAKEYFRDLGKHVKSLIYNEGCEKDLELAFHKDKANDRKKWLMSSFDPDPDEEPEPEIKEGVTISNFIHLDLKLYSLSNVKRSIPSVIDGLKPSQRKILFSALKKNLTVDMKVSQFAGYVGEHSAYHHGEMSLHKTIIGMAQDYIGSNNINLLLPIGQFGTRRMGGDDAASSRYIFTKLNPLTKHIFNPKDNHLLDYNNDDGQSIEPVIFIPIIPFALVNGCMGIGTGWSTHSPSFHPLHIIKNLENLLEGNPLIDIYPWFKGFKGDVLYMIKNKKKKLGTIGKWELDGLILTITELPIGIWTDNKKLDLKELEDKKIISNYDNLYTDVDVKFIITLVDDIDDIIGVFKLYESKSVNLTNIHLVNSNNKPEIYTINEIFNEFYTVRLECYGKRLKYLIDKIEYELNILKSRICFIEGVIDDSIVISKKSDEDIVDILSIFPKISSLKFETFNKKDKGDYEYLLSMPMRNLSEKKIKEYEINRDNLLIELEKLKKETPKTLWLEDLKVLKKELKHIARTECV